MRDSDIDDILKRAADAKKEVDPAILANISTSIGSFLKPVRALPPSWILASALVLICGTVAIAGALLLGPHGFQKMSAVEAGLIFAVLGLLVALSAMQCVAEVIPGRQWRMAPWLLVVCDCIGLGAVFGLLFHDYGTERFVSQGLACLGTGLMHALPASLAAWWILSRGFAVNPAGAGLATGTLAGLAGIAMLELHCANFEAPHVIVWHIAVAPISGAIGAWVAVSAREHKRRREGQR